MKSIKVYLPLTLNSESRRRNPFPSAFPSPSPIHEIIISPEARQWDV
jgi:hypothetical protein